MEYAIKFCVGCYLPNAMDFANALLEKHAHDGSFALKLVPGESGQFDVKRDNETIYSKRETKRLPVPGEIESGLRSFAGIELESADVKPCC
ncbi:MAG: Rdx family protein [Nitrososphaerota archaeon]|nr:Rdx family protein [Nitrososphaerota archaeon]